MSVFLCFFMLIYSTFQNENECKWCVYVIVTRIMIDFVVSLNCHLIVWHKQYFFNKNQFCDHSSLEVDCGEQVVRWPESNIVNKNLFFYLYIPWYISNVLKGLQWCLVCFIRNVPLGFFFLFFLSSLCILFW